MATDKNLLNSIVNIDGVDYHVTAEKLTHTLTIKAGDNTNLGTFDGSEDKTITLPASGGGGGSDAVDIPVNVVKDDDTTTSLRATITISTEEPKGGDEGDIWFKYQK